MGLLKKDGDITRMAIVTIAIFLAMAMLRPNLFLTVNNFTSMGYQIPELGLYSLAMMVVMITGGRDLSIVGIGNLACILSAYILRYAFLNNFTGGKLWLFIFLGIVAAVATGLVCGLINGLIIANCGISPMLVTMATFSIYTGIAIIISEGKTIGDTPEVYNYMGNHTLLGIPIPLWLLIFALIFTAILLNKTRFGFELKFVGSNPRASFFTGMNNKLILIKAYLFSGVMCSICGLEILARTNTAKADYAFTYTFQAILVAILGATNPNGGFAKISCLILSLLSLQCLSSGFNMLRLGGFFKEFAWGLLLIVVLCMNYLLEEQKRKRSLAEVKKKHQSPAA